MTAFPSPRRRLALLALALLVAPTTLALAPAPEPVAGALTAGAQLALPVRVGALVDVALVEPFDPRAPALAAAAPHAADGLFTGRLVDAGGLVRLASWRGETVGLVDAPDGLEWVTVVEGAIVPLPSDRVPDEAAFVDAELTPPADAVRDADAVLPGAHTGGAEDARDGVLQIMLDAEVTYRYRYAFDWREHQLAVIALVDAVFVTSLGVPIQVVEQHEWTEAGPLTGRIECNGSKDDLLRQFREHWESVAPTRGDAREAAHLFSMRPTAAHPGGGSLIGCGFVGALESPYAYAASRINPVYSLAYDARLVAHELGHNFGGVHSRAVPTPDDGDLDTGCVGAPTVMYPYLCQSTAPAFSGAWGTGATAQDGGNAPWMTAHAGARV